MDPNTRIIAQIKLNELRRQRDRLVAHYAALEERIDAVSDVHTRLELLYKGLRDAQFAQRFEDE